MERHIPPRLRTGLAAGGACALLLLATSACSSDGASDAAPAQQSAEASSAAPSAKPSSGPTETSTSSATASPSATAAPQPTVDDPSTRSASPRPTGTAESASGAPSSSPAPDSSAAQAPEAGPEGHHSCTTDELRVSISTDQGAAGSVYYTLGFTNQGKETCSLSGFPEVSLVDGDGNPVGAPATHASEMPGSPATLAPGQSTQAALRVIQPDLYGDQCHKTSAAGLQVSAPGSQQHLTISSPLSGCSNTDVTNLSVSQVGARV